MNLDKLGEKGKDFLMRMPWDIEAAVPSPAFPIVVGERVNNTFD
jgi:hypothetical protein